MAERADADCQTTGFGVVNFDNILNTERHGEYTNRDMLGPDGQASAN